MLLRSAEAKKSGLFASGFSGLASLVVLVCGFAVWRCQALDDLGGDELGALMQEMDAGESKKDLELLKFSCFSPLSEWNGVRNEVRGRRGKKVKNAEQPAGWQSKPGEDWITPIDGSEVPARALLGIPAAGSYRIWLRRYAEPGKMMPVTLELDGANRGKRVFGEKPLSSEPAAAQEKSLGISFEDGAIRASFPNRACWVWERWELDLQPGATGFTLSAPAGKLRLGAIFITKSKTFVPNLGNLRETNNLRRVYYRVRVTEAVPKAKQYSVNPVIGLTYHWRFIPETGGEPLWYTALNRPSFKGATVPIRGQDGKAQIPVGRWTDWIDATWSGTGGGPWATATVQFNGVKTGSAEIELAWHPHPAAVAARITPKLGGDGKIIFMVPLHKEVVAPLAIDPDGEEPAWGVFNPEYLTRFESSADIHRRHLAWGAEALQELGVPAGTKPARSFNFIAGCNVPAADEENVAKMLAGLGINNIGGLTPEICARLGVKPHVRISFADWGYLPDTHDPADPAAAGTIRRKLAEQAKKMAGSNSFKPEDVGEIKLGDEIGPIAGGNKINNSRDCKARFHAYLASVLDERRTTAPEFFGVATLAELDFLEELEAPASLFRRRLYYHSQLFKYILSADYYRQVTVAAKEFFPNAYTYANYTPHPIVLGGQTMNWSDWFSMVRGGGFGAAWGEDWASGSSWGYHGLEVVSFYAAWVECAARRAGLPSGFYNVATQGSADLKTFSLVSRNIRNIHLYSYGPRYAGAEGSNFWSDTPTIYPQIARAPYLLGVADDILAEAGPEPRRVALLYNRPDEIMNGGGNYMLADRALTFAALANAHHNADIILAEDLDAKWLKQYKLLYINGFNLPLAALAPLRDWVSAGGVLVATAGGVRFDEYGSAAAGFAELFGATAVEAGRSAGKAHPLSLPDHKPVGRVRLAKSACTPELEADLIGLKFVLTPTTGKQVASYDDGACAGVLTQVGAGQVLLLGFQPGLLYKGAAKGSSTYQDERLPLFAVPAAAAVGAPSVSCAAPQVEMTRFESPKGIAVLLANFAAARWEEGQPPIRMSVATGRQIKSVRSATGGELKFRQKDGLVEIDLPLPRRIDTVVLRD